MSETELKQERRRAWVWWAGGLAALLVPGAALQPILLPRPSPVTREAYERIENDMTLAEVERIMGGPEGDYLTRPGWRATEPKVPSGLLPIYGEVADERRWYGDEGNVRVYIIGDGRVIFTHFDSGVRRYVSYPKVIRWRLDRLKTRWFPPSP